MDIDNFYIGMKVKLGDKFYSIARDSSEGFRNTFPLMETEVTVDGINKDRAFGVHFEEYIPWFPSEWFEPAYIYNLVSVEDLKSILNA